LEAEKAKLVAGMWERKSKDLALAKVGELVRMNKIEDLTWKFGGWELEMILRDFKHFNVSDGCNFRADGAIWKIVFTATNQI
jgi:hypothetical protein